MSKSTHRYPDFIKPDLDKRVFSCPHCGQTVDQAQVDLYPMSATSQVSATRTPASAVDNAPAHRFLATQCAACHGYAIWHDQVLRWPLVHLPPPPPDHMPNDAQREYRDALGVFPYAPRASVALLLIGLALICQTLNRQASTAQEAIESALRERGIASRDIPERLQKLVPDSSLNGCNGIITPHDPAYDYTATALHLFHLLHDIAETCFSCE